MVQVQMWPNWRIKGGLSRRLNHRLNGGLDGGSPRGAIANPFLDVRDGKADWRLYRSLNMSNDLLKGLVEFQLPQRGLVQHKGLEHSNSVNVRRIKDGFVSTLTGLSRVFSIWLEIRRFDNKRLFKGKRLRCKDISRNRLGFRNFGLNRQGVNDLRLVGLGFIFNFMVLANMIFNLIGTKGYNLDGLRMGNFSLNGRDNTSFSRKGLGINDLSLVGLVEDINKDISLIRLRFKNFILNRMTGRFNNTEFLVPFLQHLFHLSSEH